MAKWFSVRILLDSEVEGGADGVALGEESTRVFWAENEADARRKAEASGRVSEHQYKNERGRIVSWVYVGVAEVQELEPAVLADGTEVWSQLIERRT